MQQVHAEMFASNVIPFRQSVLPRHREYLARWLKAGLCMGLCDADIFSPSEASDDSMQQIVVWVRESADPAYLIRPSGSRWEIVDPIRETVLSRQATIELALNFIRPVLPLQGNVVAA